MIVSVLSPRGMKSELDLNRAEGKSWNYRRQTQKALNDETCIEPNAISVRLCFSPTENKHVNAQTDSNNSNSLKGC